MHIPLLLQLKAVYLVLLIVWPFTSYALLVNRTIDDSFGDSLTNQTVIYAPESKWANQECNGCAIKPDTTKTLDGTYTAATYHPELGFVSISMQFSGVAIYVFFVLVNNEGAGVTTLTQANFTIDKNDPTFFQYTPDTTSTEVLYNQLVFSQTNLQNGSHTLVISTSGVDVSIYLCFDYAIYTYLEDDTVTPAPTTTDTSATVTASTTVTPQAAGSGQKKISSETIAWGLLGGLVFMAGVFSVVRCIQHKKKQSRQLSEIGDENRTYGGPGREFGERARTRKWWSRVKMVSVRRQGRSQAIRENITITEHHEMDIELNSPVAQDAEMHRMRAEIAFLRGRQNSVWSRTPTDDILPEYTSDIMT